MVGGLDDMLKPETFKIGSKMISIEFIDDNYGKYRVKKTVVNGEDSKITCTKFTSKSREINLSKAKSDYLNLKIRLGRESGGNYR